MKFQLGFYAEPDRMTVHVQVQLTEHAPEYWNLTGYDMDEDDEYRNPAPAYLKEIYALEGITHSISLDRYGLHVWKGALFSWDDLAPRIIQIVQGYLEPGGKIEMVTPPRMPTQADLLDAKLWEHEDADSF